MAEGPRPDARVIAAYLDEVTLEIDAVRRLALPTLNRLAAYHLEQAAEKLVKAVRLHRGLYPTKEHILEKLIDGLPPGDPWRDRLMPLEWTSAYATTYRYPTSTGRRISGPAVEELLETAAEVERLVETARSELLV